MKPNTLYSIYTEQESENTVSSEVRDYLLSYTGCIKKTEQILNRSQRREEAQSMKFLINIDCLGTYDVE